MSSSIDNNATAKSYLDFSGLGELRGQAQQNQDKALKESAQQFEGLFLQMMLKSMREANAGMKDEENQSAGMETFENMFDKEISVQMAKRGALGVADFMAKAVKQQMASTPTSALEVLNARQAQAAIPLRPEASPMALNRQMGKAIPLVVDKVKPLSIEPKAFKINGGGP
ncbi:MAG: rod-binding protein [Burkholderiales bacterium]|jgi:Rod binding domain-containing protein|nr:rod-binding protein [Burkholderiales bacterium]